MKNNFYKNFIEKRGAQSPSLHHPRQTLKVIGSLFLLLVSSLSFGYNSTDIYTDIRTNSTLVFCAYYLRSSVANTANNSDGKWSQILSEQIPSDQVFAKWSRITVGIGYQSNGSVVAPTLNETTSSAFGYNTPVSTPSAPVAFSYGYFPDISSAYSLAANLFARGYRCPTYSDKGSDRYGYKYCNFIFADLLADILNGTNVVWRQALLSSLSSIGTSVFNIDTGVSQLSPILSNIQDINSLSLSNSFSSLFLSTNLLEVSSNVDLHVERLYHPLTNIDVNVSNIDSSLSRVDIGLSSVGNTLASSDEHLAELSFYAQGNNSALAAIAGNTADVHTDLSTVSPTLKGFANAYSNVNALALNPLADENNFPFDGGIDAQQFFYEVKDNLARRYGEGTPSYNQALGRIQQSYIDDLYNQYKNWKQAQNDRDNPAYRTPFNRFTNDPNLQNAAGAHDDRNFTTNNVLRPLTNEVKKASKDIVDELRADEASAQDRHNNLINVLEEINANMIATSPETVSNVYQAVVDAAIGPITGLLQNIDVSVSNLLNVVSNKNYLLLMHYEDYITNNVYDTGYNAFSTDFPDVHSNLVAYGLRDDNIWTLFGSTMFYLDGVLGSTFGDAAMVRKFLDDRFEDGGFRAKFDDIVKEFPTETQVLDWYNQVSNAVLEIDQASSNFVKSVESVTNLASLVFSPFHGSFDSPPSSITFFKTANEKYVFIPVSDQQSVWRMLRLGLTFCLVLVNVLLFPKFVFFFFNLFMKLFNSSIKVLPTDR